MREGLADQIQREIRFSFSRSSGPGGQNVNVRDTKVEAEFDVIASSSLDEPERERLQLKLDLLQGRLLRVTASNHRTQEANRRSATQKLIERVATALKPDPPKRRKTKPSRAARERRLNDKRKRAALKASRQVTD